MKRKNLTSAADRTCRNFLRAAEDIYIKQGYSGSSIRAISDRAEANLGTMHHYWGSKKKLFEDLFRTRFEPLREHHLEKFTAQKSAFEAAGHIDIKDVVKTLISPPDSIAESPEEIRRFNSLYSRVLTDPAEEVISVMNDIFAEPASLLFSLLRALYPALSYGEFRIRVIFLITTLIYHELFSAGKQIATFLGNDDSTDAERIEWMAHFLAAGFDSPPAVIHPKTTD